MKLYRILILALGIMCVLALSVAADVPQLISYQGRLTDTLGAPVPDGDYDVRFEIWDSPVPSEADIMLWTSFTVTVSVSNGLFTHMLGSANPLPPSVFVYDGPLGRYIATEVIGQGVTPPRLPLLATPYAYQAIKSDTAGYALAGAGGGGYWQPGAGGGIYYDGGNVGIGNSRPAHTLDVTGDINTSTLYRSNGATILKDLGSFSIALGIHAGESGTSQNSTFLGHNAGQFGSGHDNTYVGYSAGSSANGESNVYIGSGSGSNATGILNTFVGAFAAPNNEGNNNVMIGQAAGHWHTTGDNNTFVGVAAGNGNITGDRNTFIGKGAGQNATGSDNVFLGRGAGYSNPDSHTLIINNTTAGTPLIYGDFLANRVGIGTVEPLASLHVQAVGLDAIRGSTSDDEGSSGVLGIGTGPLNYGVQGTVDGTLAIGVRGYASGSNGVGVSGTADAENGYGVFGSSSNTDNGIGVYGLSMGTEGCGVYGRAPGSNGRGVYGQAEASNGIGVYGQAEASNGIGVYAEATYAGATALVVDGHWEAEWAADIKGNVRIRNLYDETIVELGEGLDFAEGFNTASPSQIAPGTVMIIDPLNAGKLAVSSRAYDSRVAGIVAGANGLGSGVRLGTDQFDVDVALAGRVYCNVDASETGIEPGDLLTTSAVPGHAMKATDHLRTHGAILGKAMERLERGEKGQILVLVTLH